LNAGGVNGLEDIANDEAAMAQIVKMSDGYSGRNIEQAIEEAMDIAFDDGKRAVSIDDLKTVFSEMKPTSETKKAEIEAMREFVGNGTMRQANTSNSEDNPITSFKAVRGFA
jgi:SpoVK/Ycf46/Vps4 family AAA+-type ATPase